MMVFKSINGEPLTRIQLMKKLWSSVKKTKKKELCQILEHRSAMTKAVIEFLETFTFNHSSGRITKDHIILERTNKASLSIGTSNSMNKIFTSRSPQIWNTPDMRAKRISRR